MVVEIFSSVIGRHSPGHLELGDASAKITTEESREHVKGEGSLHETFNGNAWRLTHVTKAYGMRLTEENTRIC